MRPVAGVFKANGPPLGFALTTAVSFDQRRDAAAIDRRQTRR
jgi:hypothetical protein